MLNKVDRLGRIVIPINLRKKYNLTEGVALEFKEKDGSLFITPSPCLCRICNRDMEENATLPICTSCVSMIKAIG